MKLLVRAEIRQRIRMLLSLAAGLFVFLIALGGTYQAFGGASGLGNALGATKSPRFFSAFAGEADINIFTPANYLALGLIHPLFLVLTFTVGLSIGSGAVAADVETGRAEMLYAHPRRRTAFFDARLALWAGAQVSILVIACFGAYAGSRISKDMQVVTFASIVRVIVSYFPLVALFSAVAFLSSAVARTRGQALGAAIGAAAVAYLVNFIALLWHPLSFAGHLTPFGYYSPTRALTSIAWSHVALLLAVTIVLLLAARVALERRDLT